VFNQVFSVEKPTPEDIWLIRQLLAGRWYAPTIEGVLENINADGALQ
jgi:hypothetical protein